MSALGQKTDIAAARPNVCFTPKRGHRNGSDCVRRDSSGSFAALAAIRSASFPESLTGATQVPARYMAYKTTTAISANRANGRTADEGIESCSPYWIMDRGSFGHGRVGVLALPIVLSLTRQVEESVLWLHGLFLVSA
jgi:hypothetical protein